MSRTRAENGDIWQAGRPVMAKLHGNDNARRVVIETGEMVEFRFWNPANVRTRDGLYLSIEEKQFSDDFCYVGKILEEIYRRNNNTTAEILDARLYTTPKEDE